MNVPPSLQPSWRSIDGMALGLIYGAILVLSLLMAVQETPGAPFRPAIILFGSIFAITLARAFSELLAHAIQTHERILTPSAIAAAWRGASVYLIAANVPTMVMLAAGFGWVDVATAVAVSQMCCVAILTALGARAGWAIKPQSWLPVWGALGAGAIGSALAGLKYAIH